MTPIRQTECGKYGQAWCPAPWCPHERVCPLPNPWDRGIEWEPDGYAYQRRMGDTARRMDLRRGDR